MLAVPSDAALESRNSCCCCRAPPLPLPAGKIGLLSAFSRICACRSSCHCSCSGGSIVHATMQVPPWDVPTGLLPCLAGDSLSLSLSRHQRDLWRRHLPPVGFFLPGAIIVRPRLIHANLQSSGLSRLVFRFIWDSHGVRGQWHIMPCCICMNKFA